VKAIVFIMRIKAKKGLKRRLSCDEAKDLESNLMRKQRRGAIEPCYRPTPTERDEGEEPKCQLRFFLLAPTFRYCPACTAYRRNAASLRSVRARKAKEILVEEFRASNFDVLARDKTQLLAMNGRLAKELDETKALIAGLHQEKNEMKVAIRDWNVALQNEYAKTQSLAVQVREGQNQISSLTFQLGREASDHQATKLQIATSNLSYEDQVGYQQHPHAYQAEAPYYQQPYQQLA
jgi:hypothetical protein